MRKIIDISTSRSLAQPRLHMREVSLIASSSCQMSTQWFHQRSSSEPRSITQILISWVEFALIFWRTSGLQLSKLDPFSSPSRLWCLFQTWMIHLIKKLLITGNKIKMVPSPRPRSGPSNMLPNEQRKADMPLSETTRREFGRLYFIRCCLNATFKSLSFKRHNMAHGSFLIEICTPISEAMLDRWENIWIQKFELLSYFLYKNDSHESKSYHCKMLIPMQYRSNMCSYKRDCLPHWLSFFVEGWNHSKTRVITIHGVKLKTYRLSKLCIFVRNHGRNLCILNYYNLS